MTTDRMSKLLLMTSVILAIAGLMTLVPWAGANKLNILGYKSLCTFAPVSTLIMLFVSNTLYGIRKKKFKP